MERILEAQIEVAELWAQLGIALDHQHEVLNNIFDNVEKAKEYVKEGNLDLKDVPNITASKHRCYCFILIALVVALVIIAAPIAATS